MARGGSSGQGQLDGGPVRCPSTFPSSNLADPRRRRAAWRHRRASASRTNKRPPAATGLVVFRPRSIKQATQASSAQGSRRCRRRQTQAQRPWR